MIHGFTKQRCPKCGGNIYIDMDYYLEGSFINWCEQEHCLQCGHVIYDTRRSPEAIRLTPSVDVVMSEEKEPALV